MPERRRARLAGELVSGFLDGLAQRDVAGQRVTGNADGARGDVDVDPGDAGEPADLSPNGPGTVVARHPGNGNLASGHDRHRSPALADSDADDAAVRRLRRRLTLALVFFVPLHRSLRIRRM
jgi:hypothetical protein